MQLDVTSLSLFKSLHEVQVGLIKIISWLIILNIETE